MSFEPIQSTRIYQQIASRIGEMIVNGQLKPGDRLPNEGELASRFGVSRAPVREAMIALETAGLIEVRRSNGAYVREPSAYSREIDWFGGPDAEPGPLELFELREILLPEAAAMAAVRMPREDIAELESMIGTMRGRYQAEDNNDLARQFLVRLAAGSGNSMIQGVMEELMRFQGGRLWATLRNRSMGPEQRRLTIEHRESIVAALRAGDAEAAREATRAYLRLTKQTYFGYLGNGTSDE